jgi:hypothetical protein
MGCTDSDSILDSIGEYSLKGDARDVGRVLPGRMRYKGKPGAQDVT